jgi:hypothetical protein
MLEIHGGQSLTITIHITGYTPWPVSTAVNVKHHSLRITGSSLHQTAAPYVQHQLLTQATAANEALPRRWQSQRWTAQQTP